MAATSVAAIGALAIGVHSLSGCAATPPAGASPAAARPVSSVAVRPSAAPAAAAPAAPDGAGPVLAIASVHMSAAGMLIDLRYRVLDPVRAQRALGPKIRPKLIDERSGIEMSVPTTAKLGSLRQTQGQQRSGRSYFVLFVNTARVAPGSRVRAELGELVYPNLLVQ